MVRIAVLGAGAMGSQHARILRSMPNVEVIALGDRNLALAKTVAMQFGIPKTYAEVHDLLRAEKPDAVVIALPTAFHADATLAAISAGCHVLVEKPIAATVAEGARMIAAAQRQQCIFTVGHIERFNPMIAALKQRLQNNELGDPYLVNTVRIGPYPKRLFGQSDGALIDLASHDADIIQYLLGPITQVYAQLIMSGKQEIYAKALFKVNHSMNGSSEFSWISPQRVRKIEVYGTKGIFVGDYQQQTLVFHENADVLPVPPTEDLYQFILSGNVSAGSAIPCPVQKDEPLRIELRHFVDSILHKRAPLVSGEDALRALQTALTIRESGMRAQVMKVPDIADGPVPRRE